MQAALERELEEEESKEKPDQNGDLAMGGTVEVKEDDEASDAGSEDLEAESSDDEEEEDEEEGGEGDEDVEMGEGEADGGKAGAGANGTAAQKQAALVAN